MVLESACGHESVSAQRYGPSRNILVVVDGHSGCNELVKDSGEKFAKDLGTTSKQIMDVMALRNPAPVSGGFW
jgi:hypothetical protein